MLSEKLIALLASTEPQGWDRAIRRHAILDEFEKDVGSRYPSVGSAASAMGIGVRLFYRLLGEHRAAKPRAKASSIRDRRCHINPTPDSIIADAIRDLGKSATLASITRCVEERCVDAGVPAPSSNAIRIRQYRSIRARKPADRLPRGQGFVADTAILAIRALTPAGEIEFPRITAVIDAESGKVCLYEVHHGPVSAETLISLQSQMSDDRMTSGARILIKPSLRNLCVIGTKKSATHESPLVVGATSVSLFRLLGGRVGRIPLANRSYSKGNLSYPPAAFDAIKAVVAREVLLHNDSALAW